MDKGALGIAGLAAGIVALLVGGLAYLQANKALTNANQAIQELEERATSAMGPAEIRKAVRQEMAANREELESMVAAVRAEIEKLQAEARRADILSSAKRHADEVTARSADELPGYTVEHGIPERERHNMISSIHSAMPV